MANASASDSQKFRAACNFVNGNIYASAIANQLLGKYKNLARDQKGIQTFLAVFPSILASKMYSKLGDAKGASYRVYDNVRPRDKNTFEVPVSLRFDGNTYNAKMVVYGSGNNFALIDGMAFGMSGVAYLKKDTQKKLDAEYNKDPQNSLPVTELVKDEVSDSDFAYCN